jgi:hypothetical protein
MNSNMKKVMAGVLLIAGVVTMSACDVSTKADGGKTYAEKQTKSTPSDHAVEKVDNGPDMTTAQEQAVGSAKDYLAYQSFSRSGLIDQLKYEKFSVKDATFAVDSLDVDWNVQAAASAKDYLKGQNFSRSGLIAQLKYEGYTTDQATYGVNQTGL